MFIDCVCYQIFGSFCTCKQKYDNVLSLWVRTEQYNGRNRQPLTPKQYNCEPVERTSTQTLPITILEKSDHTSARLWWRIFTQ